MILNFRVMKKGQVEIVAQDSLLLTEKPLKGDPVQDPRGTYKWVDIAGKENELLMEFEGKRIVNVDYFFDNWTFEVAHVFNRVKYANGEWPFDDFDSKNSYEYYAQWRRKDINLKKEQNLTYDTELKYLREGFIELCNFVGMPIPTKIQGVTDLIESLKGNNPKEKQPTQ